MKIEKSTVCSKEVMERALKNNINCINELNAIIRHIETMNTQLIKDLQQFSIEKEEMGN